MPAKPTFRETVRFWLKLGFISFGGPAGQIAIMHEYLVTQKKWISESKFLHALNFCMLLPGPEAQQLATYTGWLLHGIRGGLIAGILFVLPSMFILLGLSVAYVSYGNIPWIYAMFTGLKPAVIAIVILALYKIGKKSLLTPFHYCVAVAGFVCIFFLSISFPVIIFGTILIAIVIRKLFPEILSVEKKQLNVNDPNESEYFINKNSLLPVTAFNPFTTGQYIATGMLLWIIPLTVFYLLTEDFIFWKTLVIFFTQAALVTFGGAYAVLPYVAQISVEKYHWLTNLQMIDGLALGETTPGPLIMVLAFVGFMAGYHHFSNSLLMGTAGLITTTFYTFLPCFLFIFIGAPIIERTQKNKQLKEILSLVTATVVGVVLNLTIYLANAVIFPNGITVSGADYLHLAWIIVSLIALRHFKINMILWIGLSALFGLVRFAFVYL